MPITPRPSGDQVVPFHFAMPFAPAPPAGASARVIESLAWGLGWQNQLAEVSARLSAAGAEHAVTALTDAAGLWVSHLDDVELASLRGEAKAIVVTGTGKFISNGLDLDRFRRPIVQAMLPFRMPRWR